MKRRSTIAVQIVLCLLPFAMEAQQFHFEVFTPETGLPASGVYAIDQDERGYIWVATSEGLARYDGSQFITFDVSTGLREQRIYSMKRSPSGEIWLGTEQGASYYDGYTAHNFTSKDGLGKGTVWSIAIDRFGHTWFATHAGGLSVRVRGKFRTYTTADGLPTNSVYSVLTDDLGRLWIGFLDGGLILAEVTAEGDLQVVSTWNADDVPGLDSVRTIVQEPGSRRMLVGTRGNGIFFVEPDLSIVRPDISVEDVYMLRFNSRGRLLVGTGSNGVRICTPPDYGKCSNLNRENGLPSNEILSLFEDRESNLWIGSGLGLYRWSGHQFILYTEREGLRSNRVLGVSAESPDVVWISTTDGVTNLDLGATESSPLRSRTFTTEDGLPSDEVWQTIRDREGKVWVATAEGLCLLGPKGCRTFAERDGLPGSYILTVFEDEDGAIWAGSTGGATRLTRSEVPGGFEIETFTASEGMVGTDVYAIDQGPDGRIWFASAGGVNVYDGERVRGWTPEDGLVVGTINDVLAARDGSVWFATSGAGLARYEPANDSAGASAFSTWGRDEGLPSSTIISLIEDEAGLIWLGTLDGIVEIDPARLDEGANFVLKRLVASDGIGSHDPGSGNAFAVGAVGDLWFGLATGATRYLPFGPQPADVAPVVTVESIHAGEKPVFSAAFSSMSADERPPQSGATVEIPKRVRDLDIEYRGVSLRRQKDVTYQTRLDGYDTDWSSPTKRTRKEYTNLPPGDYVFRVRSKLDGSPWGETASVSFAIPPVFWERVWFQVLIALALLGAIFLAHKLRLIAIRERNEELRALVAERTADLEERTSELERANELILDADRAKSQFLANMSHELRTPLNSIIGFTDIMLSRGATITGDIATKFLTNVSYSARHLLALINDVLDISKIEAGRMEVHIDRMTIPDIVDSVVETLDGLATPRSISIEKDVPDVLPLVWLDGTKVRQILFNLLSNAVKFSPSGSSIIVTVRQRSAETSPLQVDTIQLSVEDHGVGIAADQLGSIFVAYQQARASAKLGLGTGLGLAIVRKFSELQGGKVDVESTLGEGSTFHVWLPVDARDHDTDRTSSGKLRVVK